MFRTLVGNEINRATIQEDQDDFARFRSYLNTKEQKEFEEVGEKFKENWLFYEKSIKEMKLWRDELRKSGSIYADPGKLIRLVVIDQEVEENANEFDGDVMYDGHGE